MVNSFDSWTRLREVMLGDVYPIEWYEHLPSEVRDVFQQITEWTQEDLAKIERKLVDDFGITVQRPVYHDISQYLGFNGQLQKPEITPRDYFLVLGNVFWMPQFKQRTPAWQHVYKRYENHVRVHQFPLQFTGANTVRVGHDLFVDCVITPDFDSRLGLTFDQRQEYFYKMIVPELPDWRCHYLDNGGHVDACLSVLRPGLILANNYFPHYDQSFPGWERIMLSTPEFFDHGRLSVDPRFHANARWHLPGKGDIPRSFHEHVIQYAQDWIGNYTETFFEVNCLVIDEHNVMVLGMNEPVFRHLETLGITVHPMDFRCRTFWDGGMHCLTVDVRRDGSMATYL